jgi:hypothetical protein
VYDIVGKIKNGDMLKIKNGRVDIVNKKLVLSNDIWTKMTVAVLTRLNNFDNVRIQKWKLGIRLLIFQKYTIMQEP